MSFTLHCADVCVHFRVEQFLEIDNIESETKSMHEKDFTETCFLIDPVYSLIPKPLHSLHSSEPLNQIRCINSILNYPTCFEHVLETAKESRCLVRFQSLLIHVNIAISVNGHVVKQAEMSVDIEFLIVIEVRTNCDRRKRNLKRQT